MSPHLTAAKPSVEGYARVVRVDGATAWLEPEQTSSCGHCPSAASCAPGIGTLTNRIAARRFALDNDAGLAVGERIVVGVAERALLTGALLAYALPLLSALCAGGLAEGAYGDDLLTLLATLAGLGGGLFAARLLAARLTARGALAPQYLRRVGGCAPAKETP